MYTVQCNAGGSATDRQNFNRSSAREAGGLFGWTHCGVTQEAKFSNVSSAQHCATRKPCMR
jgi:hypothetical protein